MSKMWVNNKLWIYLNSEPRMQYISFWLNDMSLMAICGYEFHCIVFYLFMNVVSIWWCVLFFRYSFSKRRFLLILFFVLFLFPTSNTRIFLSLLPFNSYFSTYIRYFMIVVIACFYSFFYLLSHSFNILHSPKAESPNLAESPNNVVGVLLP